jgi:hypothetical protein
MKSARLFFRKARGFTNSGASLAGLFALVTSVMYFWVVLNFWGEEEDTLGRRQ